MCLCLASPHPLPGPSALLASLHSVRHRTALSRAGHGWLTTLSLEPMLSDHPPKARHCLSTGREFIEPS